MGTDDTADTAAANESVPQESKPAKKRWTAPGGIDKWDGQALPSRRDATLGQYALLVMDRYVVPTGLVLALILLALVAPNIVIFTVVVLAMISPCVVLHELAHYRVAMKAGLDVQEFSIGMGKRVLSRTSKKTGVMWSLKALPFGGSVKISGMTIEEVERDGTDRAKAYIYAPIWTRLRVALSGVGTNLLLALVTFCVLSVVVTTPEYGFWRALLLSPLSAVLIFVSLFVQTFGAMLSAMATLGFSGNVASILSMPHAIESGLSNAAHSGVNPLIYYGMVFAGLNISLAVLNLLPLYALDGGHALVAIVDGIRKVRARRRDASDGFTPLRAARFAIYNKVTGAALFTFVVVVYAKDLLRLLFDNT